MENRNRSGHRLDIPTGSSGLVKHGIEVLRFKDFKMMSKSTTCADVIVIDQQDEEEYEVILLENIVSLDGDTL